MWGHWANTTGCHTLHHLSHTSLIFVLYRWPDLNVYCCPLNSDVCHHLSNKTLSCWEEQSDLVSSWQVTSVCMGLTIWQILQGWMIFTFSFTFNFSCTQQWLCPHPCPPLTCFFFFFIRILFLACCLPLDRITIETDRKYWHRKTESEGWHTAEVPCGLKLGTLWLRGVHLMGCCSRKLQLSDLCSRGSDSSDRGREIWNLLIRAAQFYM